MPQSIAGNDSRRMILTAARWFRSFSMPLHGPPPCGRLRAMAGDDNQQFDSEDQDELMLGDEGDEEGPATEAEIQEAAKLIDFVVLPIACINEGKGAPLA
ncbi:MAG TPA: hypothetical protein ENK31_01545, partial [Nannocystis exedens]|nr:hypothetical protein [Nannocystis exedens]